MAQPDPWEDLVRMERERKAHLNAAAHNPVPKDMNTPSPPPVWGGWGQQKPRVRMPPALGRMGFPFVAPKPPPPSESERKALEFRRQVANMPNTSGLT